jgi:hypothetical protein
MSGVDSFTKETIFGSRLERKAATTARTVATTAAATTATARTVATTVVATTIAIRATATTTIISSRKN